MLVLIGMIIPFMGNGGQPKIDSLLRMVKITEADSSKIGLYIKLSKEYHRLFPNIDTNKDIDYASLAVSSAFSLNDIPLYAEALNQLGLIYRYRQQYGESMPLHIKAFELIAETDVPAIKKMIYANNAGVASRSHADYKTAIEFYNKALAIAEEENDLKNIEISSNGLGISYMSLPGNEEKGLEYLFRALEIAKAANNKLGIAMNYLSISDYYGNQGKYTISRNYLYDLLLINEDLNDTFGKGMTLQSLGRSYLKEDKDLKKAEMYFNEALDIFKSVKNELRQAYALSYLGMIYRKENRLDESIEAYTTSLNMARKSNNRSLTFKNAYELTELFENTGRYRQALDYHKLATAYKDTINIDNQKIEVDIINRKYDIVNKENEIALLEKNKSLQAAQIEAQNASVRNRGAIIFLMALSIVACITLIIVKTRTKNRALYTERLLRAEEKEKLNAIYERNLLQAEMIANQLKINPHFLFNCLNAIKYLIQIKKYEEASNYLITFSRFIRLVLETSKEPISTIKEELELIQYYLELEKKRFNDEFSYTIVNQIGDEIENLYLPTLLLQPFVENAIWHGLLPKETGEKKIEIDIVNTENDIKIRVTDNGVGRDGQQTKKNGKHVSMGNRINLERIKLFNDKYANKITYEIIDRKTASGVVLGTTVELSLTPYSN